MSTSERTSPQPVTESDVEAKTPLPPSPPSISDDLIQSDGLGLSRKRGREVSQEPSTPKPDDIDSDPMDQRDRRAPAKRNRMQTIGDDEEPQRVSPPRSPPQSPVALSSSPRHESNLRHMNRGVRKLNMREGSRRRVDTRDSRSSRERDNRSSGSGSPRFEDDDDTKDPEPSVASGRQSPSKSVDITRVISDTVVVPSDSPPNVLPAPHEERESMDQDPPSHEIPPPDSTGDVVVVPDASNGVTAVVEVAEHEAAVPLSAAEVPHSSGVKHDLPARTSSPEVVANSGVSNVFNKRLRSEEAEDVGRPRSPPPPKATTLVAPTKAIGFAAFSTNPMQAKASQPSIWGDSKSSVPSFGIVKPSVNWTASTGGGESKPTGFSGWQSSSASPFASVGSATTTLTATTTGDTTSTTNFTSSFTFKPSFDAAKPNSKSEKPILSTRQVPGGGFTQFTHKLKRFGSPTPKSRALTPDGSVSSSQERKKSVSPEGPGDGVSDDASNEAKVAFAARLAEDSGDTGDDDNEKKLNLIKQDLITGEEEEDTIYQTRTKLFSGVGVGGWKEKGTGMLKLNVRKADAALPRLEGVHRVILNEPMFVGMEFKLNDRCVIFGVPKSSGWVYYTLRFSSVKIAADVVEVLQTNVPLSKTEAEHNAKILTTSDDNVHSSESTDV